MVDIRFWDFYWNIQMTSIYLEEYQFVIKALRNARIKRGITQKQLADALKRSQSFIAKIESGERRLDVAEFILISRLIGFDSSIILNKLYKNQNPITI